MPTYTFFNKKTNEEKTEMMMISEMEQFLKDNPDWDTRPTAPMVCGDHIMGAEGSKIPSGFRDVLKKIKKANSKGITQSTINTGNLTSI